MGLDLDAAAASSTALTPDDFRSFVPPIPLPGGPTFELWGYLRNAYDFIEGYVAARRALLEEEPAKKVARRLRRMSRLAARTPGTFGNPIDSKYLVLALMEGLIHSRVEMTLERGKLAVSLGT